MSGNPDACLYHVWAKAQLKPGCPELTMVCLACGAHYETTTHVVAGRNNVHPTQS